MPPRAVVTDLLTSSRRNEISEDDDKRAEKEIQQLTDKSIADIDRIVADKEKELLAV